MASDLDAVLVQMLPHLIDNVYAARTLLRELTDWSFGVLDKMDATDFVSMDEVRSMLEIAKKFPIQIDMAVDLAAQLEAAQSAEVAIASFLSKSELDYDEYEKLTSQVFTYLIYIYSFTIIQIYFFFFKIFS